MKKKSRGSQRTEREIIALLYRQADYILDIYERLQKHVRAKPQTFTVVSNQTVHVDIDMDTGVR